jgi:hypothetical protein
MVAPYRQIHEANLALMPLTINITEELSHDDLSYWIDENNNLTGPAQESLSEQDRNGDFI